jgi:hypothetical protein
VTDHSYTQHCDFGEGEVDCSHGSGFQDVRFTHSAISRYSQSQAAVYATSHNLGP